MVYVGLNEEWLRGLWFGGHNEKPMATAFRDSLSGFVTENVENILLSVS